MLRYILILSSLNFFFIYQLNASGVEKYKFQSDSSYTIYYYHPFKKDHSVYSLSKFFKISTQEILDANFGLDHSDIKLDQCVKIPINKSLLREKIDEIVEDRHVVYVYYTVQPKDNLYRISKIFFDQSLDQIKRLNHLQSNTLNVGEKLLIGFYDIDGQFRKKVGFEDLYIDVNVVYESISRKEHSNNANEENNKNLPQIFDKKNSEQSNKNYKTTEVRVHKNLIVSSEKLEMINVVPYLDKHKAIEAEKKQLKFQKVVKEQEIEFEKRALSTDEFERKNSIFEGEYPGKPLIVSDKVTATWKESEKAYNQYFVMHKYAKINSFIEIYYPMLKTKVIARVVGHIPKNIHKRGVDLIISESVAKKLGAIDKKILVHLRYIK